MDASGHVGGEAAAGEAHDLQGTNQPPIIVDRSCGFRVCFAQLPAHFVRARLLPQCGDLRACLGVGRREFDDVDDGSDIQPRTAGQDRGGPAAPNVCNNCPRLLLIVGHRGLLRDVQHVEHMVGYPLLLGPGDFGGADVHPPVELHGIGTDDLSRLSRTTEPMGDICCQSALTRCGGTGDDYQRLLRHVRDCRDQSQQRAQSHHRAWSACPVTPLPRPRC